MNAQVPFFDLHDAVVRRAGRSILSVDSFALAEGESIALLGPNGSGKSTFVQLLTREVLPLHRDVPPVRFCGDDRATLADVRKQLGIVSATMHNQITVHLPAVEVVAGGLFGTLGLPLLRGRGEGGARGETRVHGEGGEPFAMSDEDRERALTALEQVGMRAFADQDITTMSTGQVRRVLIARALVNDPRMLVLDEPCTGLDPEGMYYVRRTMREVVQQGRAIMLVTHYPQDIIPEIDRLLLLKEGRIFADGPKQQLLTTERMTELFDAPLEVVQSDGYYTLLERY